MKRLLKGVVDFGKISQESLAFNYQRLKSANIQWVHPADDRIFTFVSDFFSSELNLPSARVLVDFFGKIDDAEVMERLKDVKGASNYEGSNYNFVLKDVVESQNKIRFMALLKEAGEVAQKGLIVGEGRDKERLEGVDAAVTYLQGHVNELLQQDANTKTRGEVRESSMEAKQEYLVAKANPSNSWGALTGLEIIDEACHGLKRGEMWIHAAFAGELKCFPGDAWVYDHISNRKVTVREIAEGNLPEITALYREGQEQRLTKARVSAVASNGVRPVFDLTLGSGRTVGATKNHPFYTLDGWKNLEDIKVGDYVAVPKKSLRSPTRQFSDGIVTIVGYLLGDGNIGFNGGFGFTAHSLEIREDFLLHLEALGYVQGTSPGYHIYDGVEVRISKNPGDSKFHKSATSPLRTQLENLGLWGLGSKDKHIPSEFYGLPADQVALLLGSLWSTDGSCHTGDHRRADGASPSRRNDITYASISKTLCLGIQSLLLQLGIQSSVSRVNTTYRRQPYVFYQLRVVTRESKRVFVETIKVVGKEEKFHALSERLISKEDQPIPSSLVEKGLKVKAGAGLRHSCNVHGRPTLGLDLARKFAELPESKILRGSLEGDLHWEPVVALDYRGDEETWDIEVPEHHSFVVNDIISHNTTLSLTWCYNLVTRYRRNVFYASLEMPFKQIRRLLCCLHTSHPKWARQGKKPLDYRKIRDGDLTEEEEAFYFEALDDFFNNEEYSRMELWCPDHDVTVAEIKLEAELLHKQMDVGFCVVDHGGLVTDPKKSGKSTTEELNAVMRDCKKMALHFNQGEGLPVLLLFQINRNGKDEASKNQGRYKLSALSYANEAERSADYVTTTYLDDNLREAGRTIVCNLKNRDNPHFPVFEAGIDFTCRRVYNLDPGEAMTADVNADEMDELLEAV